MSGEIKNMTYLMYGDSRNKVASNCLLKIFQNLESTEAFNNMIYVGKNYTKASLLGDLAILSGIINTDNSNTLEGEQ